MGFSFSENFSLADLISFGSILALSVHSIVELGGDIENIEQRIDFSEKNQARIESQQKANQIESKADVQRLEDDLKEQYRQINGKLDKLIERELDGR